MRIKGKTLELIESIIKSYVYAYCIDVQERHQYYKDNRIGKDIHTRFCWDIWHAALSTSSIKDFYRLVYQDGINDNHLDTAIKSILKTMGVKK